MLDVVTVDAEDFEFDEIAFYAHDLADGVVTLWAVLVGISSPSQEILVAFQVSTRAEREAMAVTTYGTGDTPSRAGTYGTGTLVLIFK